MRRTRKAVVTAAAVSAIALFGASACTDSDESSDASVTTTIEHSDHGSSHPTPTPEQSGAADTAVAAIQNAVNSVVEATPVTFEAGTAELTTVSSVTIRAVAGALQSNNQPVEVRTYATGEDDDAAVQLAEQRGATVTQALVDDGVDEGRITVTATANPESSDVNPDNVEFVVGDE